MKLLGVQNMVDRAIGQGTIIVVARCESGRELCTEIKTQGTIDAEPELAQKAAAIIRRNYPEANPVAVRIVSLRGTWLEEPSWSGIWHHV